VVLWDRHSAVTAVVHAGWRGFVAGVIPAAVTAMTNAGASVSSISAWVGPSICSQCYEVGLDVQSHIAAVSLAAVAQTKDGQPAADMGAGVADQLRVLGITEIAHDMRCTKETPSLYSARGGDALQRLQFVVSVDVRD
ncbi:MAG: polyphenol oxidase family protein, partial [Actinobacteria bacterium]|nr:polyphenol oxidase family protein [Actinomycetota bacterium]